VATLDTISLRLPDEDEVDPQVTATLNELRLLRAVKLAASSAKEPLSLAKRINIRFEWLKSLFVVQLLVFVSKVLGLRDLQKSVMRKRRLLLEVLIQSVNFGLGLIIGGFGAWMVVDQSEPDYVCKREWIDFWPSQVSSPGDDIVVVPDLFWWVTGVVITTLVVSLAVYLLAGTDSAPEEVIKPLSAVERFQSGVEGPYSLSEWQQVQDYLAVVAWEENCALSPVAGQTAIE